MNNTFNKKFASNELRSIKVLLILATTVYAVTALLFIGYDYSVNLEHAKSVGVKVYELNDPTSIDYTPATTLMYLYYATMALIPIYQFRYLYNKKAIDFFHSIPIKRTTLMLTKTIVGYGILSLSFAIFFIIANVVINHNILQSVNILLLTLLTGALIYTVMLFMINITNNLFSLVATTASVIIIPFFIITGVCSLIKTFTIFNVYEPIISSKFINLFNIFIVSNTRTTIYYEDSYYIYNKSMYGNNSLVQILVVLLITISLLLISIKLYNSRKSYENSHFIIFKPIRIFYISLLTFAISLILSTPFFGQSTVTIYSITIFCIFAVSVLLDVTTNFTNGKQKEELKYSIIPAVALLVLLNCSINNFYGIFDKIPTNKIQSISISKDSGTSFLSNFTDEETFDTIQTVENDLIQQYYTDNSTYINRLHYPDCYVFTYKMDNGETKSRRYYSNILNNIDNANTIANIPEYKQNVINTLNDEKISVTISVEPTTKTDADDNLTSYQRLIDYTNSYNTENEVAVISLPTGDSNDALLDALILDIRNDKDFLNMGYAHPIIGTIYIEISIMVNVSSEYDNLDPTKGIVTNEEEIQTFTQEDETLYIPLKSYYTNTLQAINYKPDYSILVLEDFPEDIIALAREPIYFSDSNENGTLQQAVSLQTILHYYSNANDWWLPTTTVDALLDGLREYGLYTDYTILSTDEELQQFNNSYTLQVRDFDLITNIKTTNYRAFRIDNKTGELSIFTEQIITNQPN